MGQKNLTFSHTPGFFGPRAGRVWSVLAVVAGFSVALFVTLRAGLSSRDQWILGDWLIDYSAGFTRRGLVGEMVRQLEGVFGFDRVIATTVLQVSILLALMALVIVLVSSPKNGLTTVLLVASPAFVLFLANPLGTLRKEILLWLLVAAVLVWSRSTLSPKAIPWVMAAVFPLLVLAHEALAFFAGFVAIMLWLLVSEGTVSKVHAVWAGSIGTVLTAGAGLVSVFWPTRPRVGQAICAELVNTGYDEALCSGAIRFLDQDLAFSVSRVTDAVQTGNYLGVYLPIVVLSLVPFLFVRFSAPMRVAVGMSVAATLPLFVVAIDWGRWIVISVWLVTLLVLRFDDSSHISVASLSAPQQPLIRIAAPVGVVAFATLWSVPHCCEPRIGFGVIDRVLELARYVGGG